jgi:hypothetical protein
LKRATIERAVESTRKRALPKICSVTPPAWRHADMAHANMAQSFFT